jgi:hypothetical protein
MYESPKGRLRPEHVAVIRRDVIGVYDESSVHGPVESDLCREVETLWDEAATLRSRLRDVESLLATGQIRRGVSLLRWTMDGSPDEGPSAVVPPPDPERWAIVELFGHRRLVGMVDETVLGDQPMLRVRVPGTTFRGVAYPAMEHLFAARAVWMLSPCGEDEAALIAARYGPEVYQRQRRDLLAELESAIGSEDDDEDADGYPDSVTAARDERQAVADRAHVEEAAFVGDHDAAYRGDD